MPEWEVQGHRASLQAARASLRRRQEPEP
jgi:hypothetical protein